MSYYSMPFACVQACCKRGCSKMHIIQCPLLRFRLVRERKGVRKCILFSALCLCFKLRCKRLPRHRLHTRLGWRGRSTGYKCCRRGPHSMDNESPFAARRACLRLPGLPGGSAQGLGHHRRGLRDPGCHHGRGESPRRPGPGGIPGEWNGRGHVVWVPRPPQERLCPHSQLTGVVPATSWRGLVTWSRSFSAIWLTQRALA